jgi:general transcription factor 3C polypeptide 5 (transcription factor C subunit 1)
MEQEHPPAPTHPLPQTPFYSVEYPGYISPTSIPYAIQSLGGQSTLDNAFKRNASKSECLLELNLRLCNPFAHPVPGDVLSTNNILMKVVRRKMRTVTGLPEKEGEYTAEVMGVIPKTARFRSKWL